MNGQFTPQNIQALQQENNQLRWKIQQWDAWADRMEKENARLEQQVAQWQQWARRQEEQANSNSGARTRETARSTQTARSAQTARSTQQSNARTTASDDFFANSEIGDADSHEARRNQSNDENDSMLRDMIIGNAMLEPKSKWASMCRYKRFN